MTGPKTIMKRRTKNTITTIQKQKMNYNNQNILNHNNNKKQLFLGCDSIEINRVLLSINNKMITNKIILNRYGINTHNLGNLSILLLCSRSTLLKT